MCLGSDKEYIESAELCDKTQWSITVIGQSRRFSNSVGAYKHHVFNKTGFWKFYNVKIPRRSRMTYLLQCIILYLYVLLNLLNELCIILKIEVWYVKKSKILY